MKWYWWVVIIGGILFLISRYIRSTSTGTSMGWMNFGRTQSPFEAYSDAKQKIITNNKTY